MRDIMFFGMLRFCNFLDIFVISLRIGSWRGIARFSRFDLLQICQFFKILLCGLGTVRAILGAFLAG